MLTNWDKVNNYEMNNFEKMIVDILFQEYIDGNSGLEELSPPEMKSYYTTFKHGWVMANLSLENIHKG